MHAHDGGDPPKVMTTPPPSCTKAFDSLYFCYSPLHQGRHYYRHGELDDCRARMRRFQLCLLSRLKPRGESERLYREEDARVRAAAAASSSPPAPPVWHPRQEYIDSVNSAPPDDDSRQEDRWWI